MKRPSDLRSDAPPFSPLDIHFARTMEEIAGSSDPRVNLGLKLASRSVAAGHVCVDLPRLVSTNRLTDDDEVSILSQLPAFDEWIGALRDSPLVGDGSSVTPLVLDTAGRLYLHRYWDHEQSLARALVARASSPAEGVDETLLAAGLNRLFPSTGDTGEPDRQRLAAQVAVRQRLCVISGGPGTGKTFTVAKILALLAEQARARGVRLRTVLAAPTGKAAARLVESLRQAKTKLDCSATILADIPEEAATIHKTLGVQGDSPTRVRHNADNPLIADVVLIDEASMVDLALMRRLVDAVPARARIILLGDKDQLASVEAGAVLGEICGGDLESTGTATGTIRDCIVQLTHSYRYESASGIGELARAINAGDATGALKILNSKEFPQVQLRSRESGERLPTSLRTAVQQGFADFLWQSDPAARLDSLDRYRVLSALRVGPFGVGELNRWIERALASHGLEPVAGHHYDRRPILVTTNNYQTRLFNGDVGVLAPPARSTGTHLAAYFRSGDGTLRELSPSRLPPHETVFAMTVHKSQGSEFDEVAVVLPDQPSPVLTRELLYTAVTRAKKGVAIYASPEIVRHTIEHRIERSSGLHDALWR